MKRRFEVEFSDEYGFDVIDTAVIELDQAVIDAVNDDWRDQLYDLNTPEEIAEHIAYNLFVNNVGLSQLDGWADQPNENARIIKYPDLTQFEIKAREIEIEGSE